MIESSGNLLFLSIDSWLHQIHAGWKCFLITQRPSISLIVPSTLLWHTRSSNSNNTPTTSAILTVVFRAMCDSWLEFPSQSQTMDFGNFSSFWASIISLMVEKMLSLPSNFSYWFFSFSFSSFLSPDRWKSAPDEISGRTTCTSTSCPPTPDDCNFNSICWR